jgi:hypothetical protein
LKKRKALAPVRSEEELQKVLFIQKSVTRAAEKELLALAMLNKEPGRYIRAGRALLKKYADYPTLTEHARSPKLSNVYKWGATFGVAAVVGSLVVGAAKALLPKSGANFRRLFLTLLAALDRPSGALVVEEGSGDEVEALISLSIAYGIAARWKDQTVLTPVGRRVLMHLSDAARFIEEMAEAHGRFQPVENAGKPSIH